MCVLNEISHEWNGCDPFFLIFEEIELPVVDEDIFDTQRSYQCDRGIALCSQQASLIADETTADRTKKIEVMRQYNLLKDRAVGNLLKILDDRVFVLIVKRIRDVVND